MLEFFVTKGQELKRRDHDVVSADTTDLKASFTLTEDFTGTITVWWRRSDKPGSTWTSTLSGNQCTIPAEALSAATDNVMYGEYDHFVFVSISDTGRTTSAECEIKVNKSAFSTNATPGTGGNPTAYEELVEQFDELKADNQTFKDNMTEQQETFENTVTENVDNIRYVVETETAPPIIEEASGAEITLEDSAYRQVRGLNLYGYSKQTQTTGAQLLPNTISFPTINGITLTANDDGTFTLNGTCVNALAGVYFQGSWGSTVEVFPIGNYTYSIDGLNSGDALIIRGNDYELNKNPSVINNKSITQIGIRVETGSSYNNKIIKPMLNSGTSALPWEPYSGGVASPSPDWPQEIHSVADDVNLMGSLEMGIDKFSEFEATSKKLYIMLYPTAGTSQVNARLKYQDGTYGQDMAVIGSGASNGSEYSVYINPSKPCVGVAIYNVTSSAGRTLGRGMIAISSSALPYHPYGHNVTVQSEGANLIDVSKTINGTYGGITGKALGDGSFLYSGEATVKNINIWLAGGWDQTELIATLRSGEYRALSSEALFYNRTNLLNQNGIISVPDGGIDITGVRLPDAVVGETYNKIIYPMLSRGTTQLPWQPYVAPSSALITLTDSLRGIPVSSGGTYTDESGQQWIADYIYRRQTDGKWMLWRNCGSIVYDGSEDENWAKDPNFERFYSQNTGFQESTTSNPKSLNSLLALTISGGTQTYRNVYTITNSTSLYVSLNGTETLDDLKQLLAQKPMTLVGILATPTVEELPENVQAELNGLYTYNLHTDMWNNDGAYMGLKYVADTKTWINNKIAGLSTAMLNQN